MGDVAQLRGQEADVRLGAEEGGDTQGGGCGGGGRRASREKRRVSASTSASSSAGDPRFRARDATTQSPPGGRGNDATRCAAHGAAASASRDSFAFADGMALVASQSAAAGLAGRSVMATNTSPRRKLTNDGIEAARETFDFVNGCDSQIFQQSIFKIMKLVPHTFDRKGVLHQS